MGIIVSLDLDVSSIKRSKKHFWGEIFDGYTDTVMNEVMPLEVPSSVECVLEGRIRKLVNACYLNSNASQHHQKCGQHHQWYQQIST